MAVSSDVTIARNGATNDKLHPYLITILRWCVSCVWSTASVFLHRLVLPPIPPIAASKQPLKPIPKQRQASTDHLHPEPKVECVVLHTPETPTLDVIFVHGLYGSLGNTWRQGDWRSKYKLNPQKISLRNHITSSCQCNTKIEDSCNINYNYETNLNETEINEQISFKRINECFEKILPNENDLITENFYNNTVLDVNVNYETQAKFVCELFKADGNKDCNIHIEKLKCNLNGNLNNFKCIADIDECKCKINDKCKFNKCDCKINEQMKLNKCKIGCGCVCDECYSYCWPKDWIKEDFPGARVISINYTSDPYLWRPLWIKGNKRLQLHERAKQMMEQLIDLGVGQRPIIWVGHSKGGLFIKQIYCEAYEAYTKTNPDSTYKCNENNAMVDKINNLNNNLNKYKDNTINIDEKLKKQNDVCAKDNRSNERDILEKSEKNFDFVTYTENENTEICGCIKKDDVDFNVQANENELVLSSEGIEDNESNRNINDCDILSSDQKEDIQDLQTRSSLWQQSAGFMFYSVPHRGSPLADIKTPITSRSIELLEISKDCQLVLDLQDRWLVATSPSQPVVRSLVETCRTLMSVLWLRIVSVDSADAGVGSLHGVAVDHREICKPSSRNCLLYTELTTLIQAAVNKCNCRLKDKES